MKELAAIARHLASSHLGEVVLATLVTVEGSSYRRPGARLLVTANGERLGSISGGCLEEDVLIRSRAVAATGCAEVVVYDTTSENDLVWGTGLGCHGIVQVLLEKISGSPAWARALAENLEARRPTELVAVWRDAAGLSLGTRLVSEIPSSAYFSAPAAAAAVHDRGESHGPPDGGHRPPLQKTETRGKVPAQPQEAGLFRQIIHPAPALTIFGAGDDAQPLVRLAKELGWRVRVADPRPAFATAARFPLADACVSAPAGELVSKATLEPDALAVVMTHHYIHDLPILRELLSRPLAYLGLLGPKKRAGKFLADFAAQGLPLTHEIQARLHAPVGLDLGAETPEEVALAILAEMQAVLARRDARPLRERQKPIHG